MLLAVRLGLSISNNMSIAALVEFKLSIRYCSCLQFFLVDVASEADCSNELLSIPTVSLVCC